MIASLNVGDRRCQFPRSVGACETLPDKKDIGERTGVELGLPPPGEASVPSLLSCRLTARL
jgi:hypothetical protein